MTLKSAFVLMPFREDLKEVYSYLISDSLSSAGYTVNRADDIKSQSNILEDIISGIVNSDLVIADLTGSNPNVYYELGIAHALQKNVILMTQEIDELPFDLRSYRVISYNTHFSKMNQAKNELRELALEAFSGRLPFGNPVKDYSKSQRPLHAITFEDSNSNEHLGLLDYQVTLEESFGEIVNIVTGVNERLLNEVTPCIQESTSKLESGSLDTRQKINVIKGMAELIQNYGAFIKPQNLRYRELLNKLDTCLEMIISGQLELENPKAKEELDEFLVALEQLEDAADEGKSGFMGLIKTMESLPKIEQNFNRANSFLATELKSFVDNIDQTVATTSRARRLGKSLRDKFNSSER